MEKWKKFKINYKHINGGNTGMGLEAWTATLWSNFDGSKTGHDMYSTASGTVSYFF